MAPFDVLFVLSALIGIGLITLIVRESIIDPVPSLKLKREHKRKKKLADKLPKREQELEFQDSRILRLEQTIKDVHEKITPEQLVKYVRDIFYLPTVMERLFLSDHRWFKSPLIVWMDAWLYDLDIAGEHDWRRSVSNMMIRSSIRGYSSAELLREALKLQHQGWQMDLDKLLVKQRKLRLEINKLHQALGLEIKYQAEQDVADGIPPPPARHPKTRVELAREELKQVRVRVAELEEEILDEEQKGASPLRRAAGVSTEKD